MPHRRMYLFHAGTVYFCHFLKTALALYRTNGGISRALFEIIQARRLPQWEEGQPAGPDLLNYEKFYDSARISQNKRF